MKARLTKMRLPAAALLLAVLTGCATTAADCDPANKDAGFITKMNCDVGGGYGQHVAQREDDVRAAQAENAQARQVLADLEAQRAAIGKTLAEKTKARDALSASVKKLLAQAKAKSQNNAELKRQLAQSQKTLSTPINVNASDAALEAQIKARQAEVYKLQKSMDLVP
ncbi:hypothetical protein [Bordetella sp. LUAb4]|uniref:hypothetical protein n=1 Tax=Bordetella sp. LUAb4 TaxID=2843195 RepID=UPI001E328810|nr:hypothetical protein [Bordetella sp. LUAb4]